MKPVFGISLLLLVAFAKLANAEADFIRAPDGRSLIRIVEKAECVSFLQDILQPEESIKDALKSLFADAEEQERKLECTAEVLRNWDSEIGAPKFQYYSFNELREFRWDEQKLAEKEKLEKKIKCINPYHPDTLDYQDWNNFYKGICKKVFGKESFNGEEAAHLKKEYQNLVEEFAKAEADWFKNMEARSKLARLLAGERPDGKKLSELRRAANCYNPYPPGNYNHQYYQEDFGKICEGKWLSQTEYQALAKEVDKASKEYDQKVKEWNKTFRRIEDALQSAQDVAPEALELVNKIHCYNPHSPGSMDYNYHQANYGQLCGGAWLDKPAAEKLEKRIRAEFPDLPSQLKKWEDEKAAKMAEERRKADAKNKAYFENYSMRRLLAHYRAHARKTGKADDLNAFCSQYEAKQVRDKKYAAKIDMNVFSEWEQWKLAQEHGLTEAEMSSINAYTGSYYKVINPAIWGKKISEKDEVFMEVANSALDQLPAYAATPVIRFSHLPEPVLAQHEVGNIVTYDAFTSTSKKQDWVWGGGGHRFVIYAGRNGKLVEQLSHHRSEEEVLFKTGTRFKVLSKKERNYGGFEFVMVEVDENGKPLGKLPELKNESTEKKE